MTVFKYDVSSGREAVEEILETLNITPGMLASLLEVSTTKLKRWEEANTLAYDFRGKRLFALRAFLREAIVAGISKNLLLNLLREPFLFDVLEEGGEEDHYAAIYFIVNDPGGLASKVLLTYAINQFRKGIGK